MKFCRGSLVVIFFLCAAGYASGQNSVAAGDSGPAGADAAAQSGFSPSPWPPAARPLAFADRLELFWHDSYASPEAILSLSASALYDQSTNTPARWSKDGDGFTRRFGSAYGQLAIRNGVHDGMASVTGLDPRYALCHCQGLLHRTAHALEMSMVTYRRDGRVTLDAPQLAGAYGSGMISTYWYPHRLYDPLVQGVQFGHEEMGEVALGNVLQEFGPDLRRALRWRSSAR